MTRSIGVLLWKPFQAKLPAISPHYSNFLSTNPSTSHKTTSFVILTYKILPDDTDQIIFRSAVGPADSIHLTDDPPIKNPPNDTLNRRLPKAFTQLHGQPCLLGLREKNMSINLVSRVEQERSALQTRELSLLCDGSMLSLILTFLILSWY
mmetsp:Transcript_8011/g.16879  ORF Transcript_8011/g.16879 Transcript_8011/m.16879 type:complete len:151 (+) Transcript_8011:1913-2365(+)